VRHEVAQLSVFQVITWNTRYVPTGPYAGVLLLR